MRRNLTKGEIVKRRSEIDTIFRNGRVFTLKGLKLVVSKNSLDRNRIIVIPVRHYGNAVQRNRIRRQIKEIWRTEKPRMISGHDFAFVVYPGKVLTNATQRKQLLSLCEKAGVFYQSDIVPVG